MITASIVLYKNDKNFINNCIKSVINSSLISKLYIIDNYPSDYNKFSMVKYEKIEYIPHKNTGYGSSHNIAIKKALELNSDYHIILNPDINFESNVIKILTDYMNSNLDIGYIIPKVTYPDGDVQYLCKLLPSPGIMFIRRFLTKCFFTKNINDYYVLKHSGYNKIMNPPCLSGCFMFLRCSTLKENNLLFDDRFFMYFEDFDLIRRIHKVAKTIYYPEVTIIHAHAKESYKSKKMLFIHIKSAIKYFNKWGWFFDKERKIYNKQILQEIEDF